MIKYKLKNYGNIKTRIEKVEALKETEAFIVLPNNRREAKISDLISYFDTFEQARSALFKKLSSLCDDAQKSLDNYKEQLGEAFCLSENQEAKNGK